MGWDIDRFPEGEVNLELICCICTCILEDPVESPCRHVFCSQCIKTWLSNQKTCPHCRAPVHKRDLQSVIPLLKNIISKQKIYCDNKERGCVEIVALENLQGHIASCSYGMVACSYEGCSIRVLRKDHKAHSEVCSKRTVMCEQGCEMFLTLGERTTHNCIRALKSHFQDVTNEILARVSKLEELVNDLVSKNNNTRNHHRGRDGGGRANNRRNGGGGNNLDLNETYDCLSYNIPSPRSYDSSDLPPYTVINDDDHSEAINVDRYSNENNEYSDSLESVESDNLLNNSNLDNARNNTQNSRRRSVSMDRDMSPVYEHLGRSYNRTENRRQRNRSRSPHSRTVTANSRDPFDTLPLNRRHQNHRHGNRNSRNYDLVEQEEHQNNDVVLRIGVSETVSDSSSSSASSSDSESD